MDHQRFRRLIESQTDSPRRLIFLGTGTSSGVPMVGCECPVCTSTDTRNQRTRPSVLLEFPNGNLLIDTTPEMRIQLLREKIKRVHAIAFTHHHADHLFGLDDARLFPKWIGGPVPVFCEQDTEECIRRVFHYAFRENAQNWPPGVVPKIQFERIQPAVAFETQGQKILPIRLEHGPFPVLGFRVGNMAYCTDVSRIPEESWKALEGLSILVLDALRFDPHPTHFSLSEALAVVERVKPGQTYFTHLSHTFDHGPTQAMLPPKVALAYDGLVVDF
jgi:phosphoribosyl 1,2-cyclic phosphate phosphodiesterase